jgi:stage V sporulation protein G
MEITEVKVFPINEEKLKAFVSVVFDRCFMVNDIKIIHGRDGLFISMPSRKKKSGEFKDVAHPLNNDTRRMIETRVVAEYERVLAERGEDLPAPPRPYPGSDDKKSHDKEPAPAPKPAAEPVAAEVAATPPPEAQRPAAPAAASQAAAGGEAAATSPTSSGKKPEVAEKGEEEGKKGKRDAEKTLEEVQEMHLRDSFWSVS